MRPKTVLTLFFYILGIVKCNLLTSENPVLTEILQAVDVATSDKHLFDVTLKLLKSICVCMRETLKLKEKKELSNGSPKTSTDEEKIKKEKALEIYKKIYNNTCFSLRLELVNKLQQNNRKDYDTDNHVNKISDNNENDYLTCSLRKNEKKSDIQSNFERILYKVLIETKNLHNYTIMETNLFRKPFSGNITKKSTIIIISLSPKINKDHYKKQEQVNYEDFDEMLNSNRSRVEISVYNTIFNDEKLEKKNKVEQVTNCNLQSLYTYLVEKKKYSQINGLKYLNKKDSVKMYIDVTANLNQDIFMDVCCQNDSQLCKDSPIRKYFGSIDKPRNSKQIVQNYKETITKIKSLVQLYNEKLKGKENCSNHTNATDSHSSITDFVCIGTPNEIHDKEDIYLQTMNKNFKEKNHISMNNVNVSEEKRSNSLNVVQNETDTTVEKLDKLKKHRFSTNPLDLATRDLITHSQMRDNTDEISAFDSIEENNWTESKKFHNKKINKMAKLNKVLNVKIPIDKQKIKEGNKTYSAFKLSPDQKLIVSQFTQLDNHKYVKNVQIASKHKTTLTTEEEKTEPRITFESPVTSTMEEKNMYDNNKMLPSLSGTTALKRSLEMPSSIIFQLPTHSSKPNGSLRELNIQTDFFLFSTKKPVVIWPLTKTFLTGEMEKISKKVTTSALPRLIVKKEDIKQDVINSYKTPISAIFEKLSNGNATKVQSTLFPTEIPSIYNKISSTPTTALILRNANSSQIRLNATPMLKIENLIWPQTLQMTDFWKPTTFESLEHFTTEKYSPLRTSSTLDKIKSKFITLIPEIKLAPILAVRDVYLSSRHELKQMNYQTSNTLMSESESAILQTPPFISTVIEKPKLTTATHKEAQLKIQNETVTKQTVCSKTNKLLSILTEAESKETLTVTQPASNQITKKTISNFIERQSATTAISTFLYEINKKYFVETERQSISAVKNSFNASEIKKSTSRILLLSLSSAIENTSEASDVNLSSSPDIKKLFAKSAAETSAAAETQIPLAPKMRVMTNVQNFRITPTVAESIYSFNYEISPVTSENKASTSNQITKIKRSTASASTKKPVNMNAKVNHNSKYNRFIKNRFLNELIGFSKNQIQSPPSITILNNPTIKVNQNWHRLVPVNITERQILHLPCGTTLTPMNLIFNGIIQKSSSVPIDDVTRISTGSTFVGITAETTDIKKKNSKTSNSRYLKSSDWKLIVPIISSTVIAEKESTTKTSSNIKIKWNLTTVASIAEKKLILQNSSEKISSWPSNVTIKTSPIMVSTAVANKILHSNLPIIAQEVNGSVKINIELPNKSMTVFDNLARTNNIISPHKNDYFFKTIQNAIVTTFPGLRFFDVAKNTSHIVSTVTSNIAPSLISKDKTQKTKTFSAVNITEKIPSTMQNKKRVQNSNFSSLNIMDIPYRTDDISNSSLKDALKKTVNYTSFDVTNTIESIKTAANFTDIKINMKSEGTEKSSNTTKVIGEITSMISNIIDKTNENDTVSTSLMTPSMSSKLVNGISNHSTKIVFSPSTDVITKLSTLPNGTIKETKNLMLADSMVTNLSSLMSTNNIVKRISSNQSGFSNEIRSVATAYFLEKPFTWTPNYLTENIQRKLPNKATVNSTGDNKTKHFEKNASSITNEVVERSTNTILEDGHIVKSTDKVEVSSGMTTTTIFSKKTDLVTNYFTTSNQKSTLLLSSTKNYKIESKQNVRIMPTKIFPNLIITQIEKSLPTSTANPINEFSSKSTTNRIDEMSLRSILITRFQKLLSSMGNTTLKKIFSTQKHFLEKPTDLLKVRPSVEIKQGPEIATYVRSKIPGGEYKIENLTTISTVNEPLKTTTLANIITVVTLNQVTEILPRWTINPEVITEKLPRTKTLTTSLSKRHIGKLLQNSISTYNANTTKSVSNQQNWTSIKDAENIFNNSITTFSPKTIRNNYDTKINSITAVTSVSKKEYSSAKPRANLSSKPTNSYFRNNNSKQIFEKNIAKPLNSTMTYSTKFTNHINKSSENKDIADTDQKDKFTEDSKIVAKDKHKNSIFFEKNSYLQKSNTTGSFLDLIKRRIASELNGLSINNITKQSIKKTSAVIIANERNITNSTMSFYITQKTPKSEISRTAGNVPKSISNRNEDALPSLTTDFFTMYNLRHAKTGQNENVLSSFTMSAPSSRTTFKIKNITKLNIVHPKDGISKSTITTNDTIMIRNSMATRSSNNILNTKPVLVSNNISSAAKFQTSLPADYIPSSPTAYNANSISSKANPSVTIDIVPRAILNHNNLLNTPNLSLSHLAKKVTNSTTSLNLAAIQALNSMTARVANNVLYSATSYSKNIRKQPKSSTVDDRPTKTSKIEHFTISNKFTFPFVINISNRIKTINTTKLNNITATNENAYDIRRLDKSNFEENILSSTAASIENNTLNAMTTHDIFDAGSNWTAINIYSSVARHSQKNVSNKKKNFTDYEIKSSTTTTSAANNSVSTSKLIENSSLSSTTSRSLENILHLFTINISSSRKAFTKNILSETRTTVTNTREISNNIINKSPGSTTSHALDNYYYPNSITGFTENYLLKSTRTPSVANKVPGTIPNLILINGFSLTTSSALENYTSSINNQNKSNLLSSTATSTVAGNIHGTTSNIIANSIPNKKPSLSSQNILRFTSEYFPNSTKSLTENIYSETATTVANTTREISNIFINNIPSLTTSYTPNNYPTMGFTENYISRPIKTAVTNKCSGATAKLVLCNILSFVTRSAVENFPSPTTQTKNDLLSLPVTSSVANDMPNATTSLVTNNILSSNPSPISKSIFNLTTINNTSFTKVLTKNVLSKTATNVANTITRKTPNSIINNISSSTTRHTPDDFQKSVTFLVENNSLHLTTTANKVSGTASNRILNSILNLTTSTTLEKYSSSSAGWTKNSILSLNATSNAVNNIPDDTLNIIANNTLILKPSLPADNISSSKRSSLKNTIRSRVGQIKNSILSSIATTSPTNNISNSTTSRTQQNNVHLIKKDIPSTRKDRITNIRKSLTHKTTNFRTNISSVILSNHIRNPIKPHIGTDINIVSLPVTQVVENISTHATTPIKDSSSTVTNASVQSTTTFRSTENIKILKNARSAVIIQRFSSCSGSSEIIPNKIKNVTFSPISNEIIDKTPRSTIKALMKYIIKNKKNICSAESLALTSENNSTTPLIKYILSSTTHNMPINAIANPSSNSIITALSKDTILSSTTQTSVAHSIPCTTPINPANSTSSVIPKNNMRYVKKNISNSTTGLNGNKNQSSTSTTAHLATDIWSSPTTLSGYNIKTSMKMRFTTGINVASLPVNQIAQNISSLATTPLTNDDLSLSGLQNAKDIQSIASNHAAKNIINSKVTVKGHNVQSSRVLMFGSASLTTDNIPADQVVNNTLNITTRFVDNILSSTKFQIPHILIITNRSTKNIKSPILEKQMSFNLIRNNTTKALSGLIAGDISDNRLNFTASYLKKLSANLSKMNNTEAFTFMTDFLQKPLKYTERYTSTTTVSTNNVKKPSVPTLLLMSHSFRMPIRVTKHTSEIGKHFIASNVIKSSNHFANHITKTSTVSSISTSHDTDDINNDGLNENTFTKGSAILTKQPIINLMIAPYDEGVKEAYTTVAEHHKLNMNDSAKFLEVSRIKITNKTMKINDKTFTNMTYDNNTSNIVSTSNEIIDVNTTTDTKYINYFTKNPAIEHANKKIKYWQWPTLKIGKINVSERNTKTSQTDLSEIHTLSSTDIFYEHHKKYMKQEINNVARTEPNLKNVSTLEITKENYETLKSNEAFFETATQNGKDKIKNMEKYVATSKISDEGKTVQAFFGITSLSNNKSSRKNNTVNNRTSGENKIGSILLKAPIQSTLKNFHSSTKTIKSFMKQSTINDFDNLVSQITTKKISVRPEEKHLMQKFAIKKKIMRKMNLHSFNTKNLSNMVTKTLTKAQNLTITTLNKHKNTPKPNGIFQIQKIYTNRSFNRRTLSPARDKTVKYNTYQPTESAEFEYTMNLDNIVKFKPQNKKMVKRIKISTPLYKKQTSIESTSTFKTITNKTLHYTFTTMKSEFRIIKNIIYEKRGRADDKHYKKVSSGHGNISQNKTLMHPLKLLPPSRQRKVMKRIEMLNKLESEFSPQKYFVSYSNSTPKSKSHWTPMRINRPATFINPRNIVLRPKFERFHESKPPRTYFRPKPLIFENPNDKDFYKSNYNNKPGLTVKEKEKFLEEILHESVEKEGSVRKIPSLMLPEIKKPKFLKDRIDSIRSFIAVSQSGSKDYYLQQPEVESGDQSALEPSRFYYYRRNLPETTTLKRKTRRKRRTIFFLSPTVPYNRYF